MALGKNPHFRKVSLVTVSIKTGRKGECVYQGSGGRLLKLDLQTVIDVFWIDIT